MLTIVDTEKKSICFRLKKNKMPISLIGTNLYDQIKHYEKMSMLYTEIFKVVKNESFQ